MTMKLKRKGLDFCAEPGCLSSVYGGELGELVFCPEHFENAQDENYEFYLAYACDTARRQGVKFGVVATS
jgi:hypothetical protein